MARHHKSNKQVEGNPETGHGSGMPRRPDEDELLERIKTDRMLTELDEAGQNAGAGPGDVPGLGDVLGLGADGAPGPGPEGPATTRRRRRWRARRP